MPLDKPTLVTALTAAFNAGLSNPAWSQADAAQALADAIDAFVKGADVTGITTAVADPGGNPIGTGTQTGTGGLS